MTDEPCRPRSHHAPGVACLVWRRSFRSSSDAPRSDDDRGVDVVPTTLGVGALVVLAGEAVTVQRYRLSVHRLLG